MTSRQATSKQRKEVFSRSRGRCGYCSRRIYETTFHCDHRIPWHAGGKTVLSNLIASCRKCNLAKGVRTEAEFRFLLDLYGLTWRDKEAQMVTRSFVGSTEKVPGVSNPTIGLKKRQQALARRAVRELI